MDLTVSSLSELHAALLQGLVTLGTGIVCWFLYARYRRSYFLWWSIAWSLYAVRIGAIVAFLLTADFAWLFIHQILTGWTALALLWGALTFTQGIPWRRVYVTALLFPLAWSYIAIYELQSFILAAIPAVLFLSLATLWTGWVFFRRWRSMGSGGAAMLAVVLFAWGVHHLDYPILRARGAWNPWGYYLDILFVLAMGIGIVMLGLEELDRRAAELERISARMVRQHEDERRRVSLELHDQTAQVWAAVKMQLGLVREAAPEALEPRLDHVLRLVDQGIHSIRSVTNNLRPPLLDDLGLLPALRALVQNFANESGLEIAFEAPIDPPSVDAETGLALFRALQEALSNVVRHSGATAARVRVGSDDGQLTMVVHDNGRGFPADTTAAATLGLAGMRERITAVKGSVTLASSAGASVTVRVPVSHGD
ncbi:MAG: sensor histidine kinase [Gemmatimonadaceae bacterium]